MSENAKFAEVFNLMDTRGFGRINLEAFFEFTDTLPGPPSHEDIAALYQDFDDDGSGDIDGDEFGGLCAALEQLVNLNTDEMIAAYTRRQYEKLFELVDEDGGGTIDKAELKAVVEPLQGILGLKTSAADVAIIFRNMGKDELNFEDFLIVMAKIAQGRPIGQVVRAFQWAQKRSSEVKENASLVFDEEKRKAVEKRRAEDEARLRTPPPPGIGSLNAAKSRPCLNCARKDLELQELRERIERLERESLVSDLQDREREPTIEPQLRDGLEKVEVAAGFSGTFPGCLRAALQRARASRIKKVAIRATATPMDVLAKELAAAADASHKAQLQLQGIVAPMIAAISDILASKQELLDMVRADPPIDFCNQSGVLTEMLAKVQSCRSAVQGFAEDGAWVLEQVVEHRSNVCDIALAGAPFSSAPRKLMESALAAEEALQAAVETTTLALYFGTENPCEVEELLERALSNNVRSMSLETLDAMQNVIRLDREFFSKTRWESVCAGLKETVYKIQAQGTSFVPRTKDRGCNTVAVDFIEPLGPPAALLHRRVDPLGSPQQQSGGLSRPPRQHKKRRDVIISQELVDALLRRATRFGARVPSNFRRVQLVDNNDVSRHVFQFGTKRIDLVVVDESLMVHVGGGFLTFREFCDKYCEYEQSRIDREAERQAVLQTQRDASSPNYSQAQTVFQGSLRSGSNRSSSPFR